MERFELTHEDLRLDHLQAVLNNDIVLELSESSRHAVRRCRTFLDQALTDKEALYYGINTGFGFLCNVRIDADRASELQSNLVRSHACGIGPYVPLDIIRLVLFLKIRNLSYGFSAVREVILDELILLYNSDFLPVLYTYGSLGASGDLAPLAHLSLPLMGEGDLWQNGAVRSTAEIYDQTGHTPIKLKEKEGLALLNGTQFSTAYGVYCCLHAERLLRLSNIIAALSIDAFNVRLSPFDERLQKLRPHAGQFVVAKSIRSYLQGSDMHGIDRDNVQDPYSFRCVPQVHGASFNAIEHVRQGLECEINAVTDNPSIFPESEVILSGGNFHAQPIALLLDYLCIALAEMASISERRVFQLINGDRGLPLFLVQEAGINSGLMIAQYTAASIVSHNKQLCTPSSVDSIVSSKGQEDHVSMAANAATRCYDIVQNVYRVLAIELLTACQAFEFRRPRKSSVFLESVISEFRRVVLPLHGDRVLYEDLQKSESFLRNLGDEINT